MQPVERTSDRESDAGHDQLRLPTDAPPFHQEVEMAGQPDLSGLQLKCLAFDLWAATLFNHLRSRLGQPSASEHLPEGKSAWGSRIGNTGFPSKIRLSRFLLLR